MNGKLILIRHGESLWNAKNIWTGWTDIGLSDKGKEEAKEAGELLHGITLSCAFVSDLLRAQQTLQIILATLGYVDLQITKSIALNERDYGVYTGKNKLEVKASVSESDFLALRRGWDTPIPSGESLKQVYARVVPYYVESIAPLVQSGKTVLIVAHGNSLRALMKYLEHISDVDIASVELKTGEIIEYEIDAQGGIIHRGLLHV